MSTILGNASAQLKITQAGVYIKLNTVDALTFDPVTNQISFNGFVVDNTHISNAQLVNTLDANSQLISNVANAVSDTDALNKQTANGLYYLNTVPLDQITLASADVSINSHKITTMARGAIGTDAMSLAQNPMYYQCFVDLTTTQSSLVTGLTVPYVIPFDESYKPSVPSEVSDLYTITTGKIVFNKVGVYKVTVNTLLQYDSRTDLAATVKAQLYNADNSAVTATTYGNVVYPTIRPIKLLDTVLTSISHLIDVTATSQYLKVVLNGDSGIKVVSVMLGTNCLVQAINYTE